MVVQKTGRKEALVPRDMDRLTELLLDPFVSFTEAEAILNTEKAVRDGDDPGSGVLIRGNRTAPAPCAC